MQTKDSLTTRIRRKRPKAADATRSPRKIPTQKRGKLTFDAILDAAGQLLVERGYLRTTTNSVAERSGVSIGSLYQYFPNKQALVTALYERHVCNVSAIMKSAFEQAKSMPLDEGVAHNIGANFRAHEEERNLHQALELAKAHVPKLRSLTLRAQVMEAIAWQLQQHAIGTTASRQVLAELIFETVEAISHRAVVDRAFSDAQLAEQLVVRMIVLLMRSSPGHGVTQ